MPALTTTLWGLPLLDVAVILAYFAVLYATTFCSFPREFWTPAEQLHRGGFSVSFQ